MTALALTRRVRRALGGVLLLRAAAWGVAAPAAAIVLVALVDLLVALPEGVRRLALPLAAVAAAAAALASLWRGRRARALDRVALWIEEREPALHYTLVTSLERERAGASGLRFEAPAWRVLVRRSASRALVLPVSVAAATALLLAAIPAGTRARVAEPAPGDALARRGLGAAPAHSRLAPLLARVAAPRYAAVADSTIDEPASVRALVGSTVTLEGRGSAAGLAASLRPAADSGRVVALAVAARGDRWRASLVVGAAPAVVRLADGAHERIVTIEPAADAAPQVTLVLPAHDSVLAHPGGRLPLAADVADDHGLADARFELIVSSGEGENFTFRSTILGARSLGGRSARIESVLPLDSLALAPGSVLHLRAIARDRDDVSGPGVGASETRVLRVPRAGEGDSVAVDAAPPPELRSVISERMLIVLAEALERRRPSLARAAVIGESQRIGADQRQLRREVGSIVFARAGGEPTGEEVEETNVPANLTPAQLLARAEEATARDPSRAIDFEGGEAPVVAINRPLLEAYNAMWEAGFELEQGEPGRALPHMRRALDAIQRARAAERVYLRGRVPAAVVDVAAARLRGKERGDPGARTPRAAADPRLAATERRFARAMALLAAGDGAAADSLMLLRIDALGASPRFAAALGDAGAALRRGDGAAAPVALSRARRELAGAPVRADSLGPWLGAFAP